MLGADLSPELLETCISSGNKQAVIKKMQDTNCTMVMELARGNRAPVNKDTHPNGEQVLFKHEFAADRPNIQKGLVQVILGTNTARYPKLEHCCYNWLRSRFNNWK